MERITSAVKQELSRFGAQGGMPELVEAWPEVVGQMVAANAWPARIARDGTLHVNTSSSAWAFGDARTPVPEPTPEALQRAAELAAGIEDDELRKRVERAASLGLSTAPDDLPF